MLEVSPLLIVIVLLVMLILNVMWKYITSNYSFIYCPHNIPIFGTSLHLEKEPEKVVKQVEGFLHKGNGLFLAWIGWKPIIISGTSEYIGTILSSQKLTQKSFFYHFFHEWLGTSLLTSDGAKWKNRRHLLTPSFHFSILKEFVPVFEKISIKLVNNLRNVSENNEVIDIQKIVRAATLEAMCETSMGVNIDQEKNALRYMNAVHTLNELLHLRERSPWLWSKFLYSLTPSGKRYYENLKFIHQYTLSVISKRITSKKFQDAKSHVEQEEKCDQKLCLIDMLLESYKKGEIDVDGIREEVDTFVFEGHDTTASAISFCLYLLGRNQNHQTTLQSEIDSAEGDNVYEKICNMRFLDYVFKEALRLYPPVPLVARCLSEDTIIDGHTIYKGTDIGLGIGAIHKHEKFWKDPEDFNPYRFTEALNRNPYSYVPFSAGPRNCIGQRFATLESKICIFYVLKNYNLIAIQERKDIEFTAETVAKSKNGLLIKFVKRT